MFVGTKKNPPRSHKTPYLHVRKSNFALFNTNHDKQKSWDFFFREGAPASIMVLDATAMLITSFNFTLHRVKNCKNQQTLRWAMMIAGCACAVHRDVRSHVRGLFFVGSFSPDPPPRVRTFYWVAKIALSYGVCWKYVFAYFHIAFCLVFFEKKIRNLRFGEKVPQHDFLDTFKNKSLQVEIADIINRSVQTKALNSSHLGTRIQKHPLRHVASGPTLMGTRSYSVHGTFFIATPAVRRNHAVSSRSIIVYGFRGGGG